MVGVLGVSNACGGNKSCYDGIKGLGDRSTCADRFGCETGALSDSTRAFWEMGRRRCQFVPLQQ